MARDYHYRCDEKTYKQMKNLIGGREIYSKEFNLIVTNLVNKAAEPDPYKGGLYEKV